MAAETKPTDESDQPSTAAGNPLKAKAKAKSKGLRLPVFGKPAPGWVARLEQLAETPIRGGAADAEPRDERVARALTELIKTVGFRNHACQLKFFDVAQANGLHVMRRHFYNPMPDTSGLDEQLWERRADADGGVDMREQAQLELLKTLGAFSHELQDVPVDCEDESVYRWGNPAFWPGDGAVYYSMIRSLGAKRILEVGSGHSTRMAAKAAAMNGAELSCIEPYPMESLKQPGFARLIESPVQEVPLETFDVLEAGDILFIDSTHVSKIGSDVNHLFLRVIPRLKPGVVIHVHDIFLPWEMPRAWVVDRKIFWNEQYMLQALLTCNPSFEVLLGNQFLGRLHKGAFKAAFPCIPDTYAAGGVSFWFRRA